MAVTHTPPDRSKVLGNKILGDMSGVELSIPAWLATIRTLMEAIDGGEANATDESKMAAVQEGFNFKRAGTPSNAAAVEAIAQLQAARGALLTALPAVQQCCDRLRG